MSSASVPGLERVVLLQAAAGLLLCALGYFLAHRESYEVRTVLATAGGCMMPTDIYEPRSGTPLGSVVLFHGLSANRKVMSFTAEEFANQDLRVFVPDLPGHGKTPGPFTPSRVESCAQSLVRDLAIRRAIIPERTILAGHSMGGAVAARVASHIAVAGVVAISPAPMHPAPGLPSEMLLFPTPPALAPHSLVLSAAWEPATARQIASDLVTQAADSSNKYEIIPRTTHVSILFARATFEAVRSWCADVLGTSSAAKLPRNLPALGCLLGILGLTILTPPFLREMTASPCEELPADSNQAFSFLRSVLLLALFALLALLVLRSFVPFRFLHIFQGDYLASFLFLVGAGVLAVRYDATGRLRTFFAASTLASAAAGIVLLLLFAAWFELTFYEAWLTPARWLHFPALFLALLPWHLAEDVSLGSPSNHSRLLRVMRALAFRTILWLALVAGILYLHSAQFAFVLLLVYFVLFSILQRMAMDVIRARTRSAAAAAIFGAILLAGFASAILPIV
jgi:pimeloyl-ACP methyl ester carboxylesterase